MLKLPLQNGGYAPAACPMPGSDESDRRLSRVSLLSRCLNVEKGVHHLNNVSHVLSPISASNRLTGGMHPGPGLVIMH